MRDHAGGTPRPYFAEYVRFGMLRFVRGQYADAVRCGGMLAFVLNGDVPGAIAGVEENIRQMYGDLGMPAPGEFLTSTVRPTDPRIRETQHTRSKRTDSFRIHHLFMAGDPNAPLRPDPPVEVKKPKRK